MFTSDVIDRGSTGEAAATQERQFYHSAVYQAARANRLSAAEFRMTLLQGASDPARA
jgi:hypothetical protein